MPHETESRLNAMGIILPRRPKAIGNYLPGVVVGNILYTSGTLGTKPDEHDNDVLPYVGKVGSDLSIEEGYQSARLMAINHLAMMKAVLGDLDRVKRIVKMIGYVTCAPDFTEPHLVLNGASDLFVELWGEERGKHARAALTQHTLGLNAPVEADITIELYTNRISIVGAVPYGDETSGGSNDPSICVGNGEGQAPIGEPGSGSVHPVTVLRCGKNAEACFT